MHKLFALLLSTVLLGACSRGNDAAATPPPLISDAFDSAHFLQYLNHQPSLAAGDYTLVVAPAAAGTGTYALRELQDDGLGASFMGSWSALASANPADADNPRHALTLALPGGLAATLESSAAACAYLLDRGGNILARTGDTDLATPACDGGAMTASVKLPRSKTNDASYARAYYATIDPNDARDTLTRFRAVNGFTAADAHVIFRDTKDLGYGRDMYFHDGGAGPVCRTYAFYVNNFVVNDVPGLTYGPLNLDAAIGQVAKYHIGTNAIEFGPIDADNNGSFDDINGDGILSAADCFPRFYNFAPADGARRLMVDLDGKGDKAMPVPCIVCHGGRADPLLPKAVNANPYSYFPRSGDTFAHLQILDAGTFEYSANAPWTRAEVEVGVKVINAAAYESYAALETPPLGQWDSSQARALLEGWYGGAGLPAVFNDQYLPSGWQPNVSTGSPPAGADTLYHRVLADNCRTCHLLRGIAHQSDIDFTSWSKFVGYADRIEPLVYDRGSMPLATLPFTNFYADADAPEMLASFLPNFSHVGANGAPLLPGRPVADAGPDRTTVSPAAVSGVASVFASRYHWSIVSMPTGAIAALTGADSVRTILTGSLDGQYTLSLVVGNGATSSAPDTVVVTLNSAMRPAPAALTFNADIKPVLASAGCTSCHKPGGNPRPPVFYSDPGVSENRDVYTTVRSLVNFEDPVTSRLLLKPSGHHHAGGTLTGFDLAGNHARYDLFLNWILEGAREN